MSATAISREIVIPYQPRPLQRELHDSLKRFNVLVLHRRAGKTIFAINRLVRTAVSSQIVNPRTFYVAPHLKQAKTIAWDWLKHYCRVIPGHKANENELRMDFPNGGRVQLLGAEGADKHRGVYADDVVFDEVAQMAPSVWREIFRPALSDRKGTAEFIGTPKGRNFFMELYESAGELDGWFRALRTVDQTGIIDADELKAMKAEMTEEEYAQEMLCSWEAALAGAYYATEMQAMMETERIGNVPHDPALPVITAWDLGLRDSTVISFWQVHGPEVRLIEVVKDEGVSLPELVRQVQERGARGYTYTEHLAPHDIEVRELGTGKSRLEVARELGLRFTIAPKLPVLDGINAVRALLPRTWIDRDRCFDTIEALRQYTAEYDDVLRVWAPRPLHNWASHYADSVRVFATGYSGRRSDWGKPIDYSRVDKGKV